MSRALRKQMFTLIDLLEKANRTLDINLAANILNEDGIRQLLYDCQETTLMMGNELEMIYGEGTELIHKLEEYHEDLYQMTLVLSYPEPRLKLMKKLVEQIYHLRKLLDVQISDKLEVVFLPYKASCWDSMEPLWEASKKDDACEVYVVPIPYYDRGVDGSFNRYHYEGEKMPPHIHVVHYENYDLQKRWPDTVFIQNPYDQNDPCISVDPRFYSQEIKKVADTLIYISFDETEKSCITPGVLNADMVIVPSEEVKQRYVNILIKEFGESTKTDWESKIFSTKV